MPAPAPAPPPRGDGDALTMPAVLHRGPRRRTISEINMVPFIDVMLVLLIIFMVTAPLITAGVVDLPTRRQGAASEASRT